MKELSDEMKQCLERARKNGGLIRRPGGYWTSEDQFNRGINVPPIWYFGTNTITALIRRGLLKPTRFMRRGDPYFVEPIN